MTMKENKKKQGLLLLGSAVQLEFQLLSDVVGHDVSCFFYFSFFLILLVTTTYGASFPKLAQTIIKIKLVTAGRHVTPPSPDPEVTREIFNDP
jgi:hypothetical protein